MLKQNQQQKMLQKLSPQQIQLMKLLQIPTATLEQRIQEELEANPALEDARNEEDIPTDESMDTPADSPEEGPDETFDEELGGNDDEAEAYDDDMSLDEYIEDYLNDEDEVASYKLQANNTSPDDEDKQVPMAVETTFHDYLESQIGMLDLDERETKIALQIIGSIDDDGYLRREPISITDDLAFSQNILCEEDDIINVLFKIHEFDPPGIGARNLQECLIIQLRRKLAQPDNTHHVHIELAIQLLDEHFEEFTKKHFDKLKRQLACSDDDLKGAMDEILKLNPKPASGYSSGSRSKAHYVVPDFIITNSLGDLELTLNARNAPDLRVNDQYKNMLQAYVENNAKTKSDKEAVMFIKQKIDSAKWFIDAIRQRQNTMFETMYAIMQYQREFFLTGDEKVIKPMILKDIADITNLDISTVSRVANSKYVQTEFGTKRLKDFFSESLSTDSGEEVSTLEVKKILTEVIEKESKRKPLSDEKLKDILQERGYNIARRTVAKYREQLGVPVARLRKEL
jgi:RNA polymerase sigma-54 factor